LIAEASEKTKIRIDLIFENWLYNYFEAHSKPDDIFLFTKDDMKYKIIKNRNLVDQGDKEPDERTFLSETIDGRVVEFLVNTKTRKWSHKIVDREAGKDYTKTNFKFKDGRLVCRKWNSFDDKGWIEQEDLIKVTYIDGVKVEIIGKSDAEYRVTFTDKDVDLIIHRGTIRPNHWVAPNARYYVNWNILIDKNEAPYKIFEPDFVNDKVLVYFDSKALGDTLAWFPYAKVFKEKHGCKDFYVSTFWNKIFEKEYPDLRFVEPGALKPNIFYTVGCRDNDYHSNKNNWRLVPLQKVATDYLGLDYEEIKPKITAEKKNVKKPYVTISEHSTLLCKRWHYPLGWQIIINYIKEKGYDVMVVSKETTQLSGIVDRTNSTIQQTINNIYNSKLFIGVGSGLSWLSWALNIPTILISGFSEPWSEMKDCIRIVPPEGVCRGCYNDIKHPYDRGNWLWCPRNKKYECSRTIAPDVIIESIDKIL
jgi:autotransporter strand-loop-strand O-heptosyltransferase